MEKPQISPQWLIILLVMMLLGHPAQGKEETREASPEELKSLEPDLPDWSQKTDARAEPEWKGSPIKTPFGLKWGESPEVVREWSEKKGYKRKRYENEDNLILEVEGPFEKLKFQIVRFHYLKEKLQEIELEYPPKKTESDGLYQLALIKDEIEADLGKGGLQPQEEGKTQENFWRVNRYQWSDPKTVLWLVSFQLKTNPTAKKTEVVSITSLHYRSPQ